MLNLSDKDLDRLSREAAEQFEPDEHDSSWDKLSAILDREIGNEPPVSVTRYRVSPYLYGGLILLMLGTAFFLMRTGLQKNSGAAKSATASGATIKDQNHSDQNKPSASARDNKGSVNPSAGTDRTASGQQALSNAPAPGMSGNPSGENSTSSATKEVNPGATANAKGDQAISGKNTSSNNKNESSGHLANGDQPQNKTFEKNAAKTTLVAGAAYSGRKGNVSPTSGGGGKNNGLNQASTSSQDKSQGPLSGNSAALSSQQGNSQDDLLKHASLPAVSPLDDGSPYILLNDSALRNYNARKNLASQANAKNSQKNARTAYINRSLKIGLVAGPDYTNVKSADNNKFSGNVGLTVGYEVFKHLSINTGFIYTKKNYGANGGDFHGKPGWLANDSILFVNGNCNMFEIPLTVRYDFSTGRKTTFFVNGGVSSYLMTSESYQFIYTNPFWPPIYPWSSDWKTYHNPTNYLFAVASLSAGVEQQLGKGFSLQAEPFAKIPLKGVGVGSLQLSSYGIYFSLRYAPVLKHKHQ